MTWLYNDKPFDEKLADDFWGFVYIITNLVNGRQYIGKKQFRFKKSLPPLKGKKNKRIRWIESDWKTYWGSNDVLKRDVEELGEDNFRREILHLCKSRSSCSYLEAREQFLRNVIVSDSYYNDWISVKVRKSNVLKEELNS